MWVKHTPRGEMVYVLADEMTESQARALEKELRAGRRMDDIIDAVRGCNHGVPGEARKPRR